MSLCSLTCLLCPEAELGLTALPFQVNFAMWSIFKSLHSCLSLCVVPLFFHFFFFLRFFVCRASMVSHKEFETAGKKPGLQVWRIENLDLKPLPENAYGTFYTGDAYLLLFTTPAPSYNIHMWLGKMCTLITKDSFTLFFMLISLPSKFVITVFHKQENTWLVLCWETEHNSFHSCLPVASSPFPLFWQF